MKKRMILPLIVILLFTIIASACGNDASNNATSNSNQGTAADTTSTGAAQEETTDTITYQSETGPVEIPAKPERIVSLSNGPNILSMDVTPVGVDEWTAANPLFKDKLKDVAIVTDSDPESIAALNPDLIIAGSTAKNLEQLAKIAPTIVYTWGKLDYLDQQVEIGKVLNKEAEAQAWVDDFTKRAGDIGDEIKAKYGDNVTVSTIEIFEKEVFVMGDHWARGTEALYQAMKLNMPEQVKNDTLQEGYHSLSLEVLPEYMGEFVVVSRDMTRDNEIMKSTIWSNIPAVQNKHVIELETKAVTYSDPTTLEYVLNIFKEAFLGESK
ncbi:ABC transporter substrate-binding protein [Paenibacillus tundrae]